MPSYEFSFFRSVSQLGRPQRPSLSISFHHRTTQFIPRSIWSWYRSVLGTLRALQLLRSRLYRYLANAPTTLADGSAVPGGTPLTSVKYRSVSALAIPANLLSSLRQAYRLPPLSIPANSSLLVVIINAVELSISYVSLCFLLTCCLRSVIRFFILLAISLLPPQIASSRSMRHLPSNSPLKSPTMPEAEATALNVELPIISPIISITTPLPAPSSL